MVEINKLQIEELCSISDDSSHSLIVELIEIYENQLSVFLTNSEASIKTKDFQQLSEAAHKMKSSAGNLGLETMHILFKSIEDEGRLNKSTTIGLKITDIAKISADSIEALQAYLRKRSTT